MQTEHNLYLEKRLPPLIAYCFLFLIFISTFRIFATLPFETLHQAISNAAIVFLLFYYILSLVINFNKKKIKLLDILIWIFILINLFAAYQGKVVFGQPYFYGIMAQRAVLLSLSGILLISLLNKGLITINQIEKSFLFISIGLLITCYFFILFIDPKNFISDEFVAYSSLRGYRYRFQFALVIMLLFYSLFKISKEKKSRYFIPVFLILFYLIYFLQSRTTLVVLAITLLIYFYRNFTLREKIRKLFIYGSLLIVVVAIFLSLGLTSLLDKYQVLFGNVLNTFMSESPDEASSAIRLMEYRTAFGYILKNPFFGNGFISNQWNGGWHELLGYFYPVDIGIIGNIFIYGLIGTAFIYLPYYFSLKMSRQIKTNNVFYKTCEYMLLFFFFSMFFSAVNIRDSSSILFLVCMIYYFRYYYFSNKYNHSTKKVISPL